jgi:hypothetical protein
LASYAGRLGRNGWDRVLNNPIIGTGQSDPCDMESTVSLAYLFWMRTKTSHDCILTSTPIRGKDWEGWIVRIHEDHEMDVETNGTVKIKIKIKIHFFSHFFS